MFYGTIHCAQCGTSEVSAIWLVGWLVEVLEPRYYSYFSAEAALERSESIYIIRVTVIICHKCALTTYILNY